MLIVGIADPPRESLAIGTEMKAGARILPIPRADHSVHSVREALEFLNQMQQPKRLCPG